MDTETLKVLAPYFISILGAIVAIGIAVYNNSSKTKAIQNKLTHVDTKLTNVDGKLVNFDAKLTEVDEDLQGLKKNHFFHLGNYLKKLNAFLHRGNLMDDVEKVDMDYLADGVAGKQS